MIGNTLVIGFGHKARNGKDSAARFIHEAFPEETRIYSFAAALKAYARVAHGMGQKDAPLLQNLGLAFRQQKGPDFWVNILRHQIAEEAPRVALITDVRFPNEAGFCDAAIKVTRLVAAEFGLEPFVADDRPANHPSETALDNYEDWFAHIEARDLDELSAKAIDAFFGAVRLARESGFQTEAA